MFSRTERVIGKNKLEVINNSSILLLGLGGVGGYIAEMLTRIGIGNITLVDYDKIDVSNLNRQIIAQINNIGCYKTQEFEKRLLNINPNCKIKIINEKITKDNISIIFENNYSFVIDAIDDILAKVEVAKYCKNNNLNLISSMGTGNRYRCVPQFEICDIFKTSYDKLAKKMRKLLKNEGIEKLMVCYTKNATEPTESLGSVVYYPLMCAGAITSYVINKIIN